MATYRFAKLLCTLALALGMSASSVGIFALVANHSSTAHAQAVFTPKISYTKGPQLKILDEHTVNAAAIPKASQAALQQANRAVPLVIPAQIRTEEAKTSLAKRAAAAPHNAGESLLSPSQSTLGSDTSMPAFPSTFNKFAGQSDTSSTCGNSDCAVSFPAVAAAPTGLALQVVNDSLALYNNDGVLQSGWPKTAKAFFDVPNPTPAGCDPSGPYLWEPRAWFDAYDNRFAVSILQDEDFVGIAPSCTFTTLNWVAVSTTSNPNGTWRIFSFAMNFGSDPTAWADYNQFGFDADGIFFTANLLTQSGAVFEYAEIIGCGKQAIYDGGAIVCNSDAGFGAGGSSGVVQLDTISPVESLSTDFSPHAEFFVNTFNFNGDVNGHNCLSAACNGAFVWAWSDPANTNQLSADFIDTDNSYVDPPDADEPSCTGGAGCLFDSYTQVSGTPTYHAGHIYFAHQTGVVNASDQFVPGIQWFDIEPQLANGWPAAIEGATEDQDAILNAKNDWLACVNPVIMPDLDNDLILGYDYTGDTQYPSINYTFRRVTDLKSAMTGGLGIVEVTGTASTTNTTLGFVSGMSYPATYQDFVWLTSTYATSSSLWNTELIKLRFNLDG